jgi:hypothetical protein
MLRIAQYRFGILEALNLRSDRPGGGLLLNAFVGAKPLENESLFRRAWPDAKRLWVSLLAFRNVKPALGQRSIPCFLQCARNAEEYRSLEAPSFCNSPKTQQLPNVGN